jgi:hypothetical protein
MVLHYIPILLENHFVNDNLPHRLSNRTTSKVVTTKKIIMLTIATFKKFCVKAGTRQMKNTEEVHAFPPPHLLWCRKLTIFYTFLGQLTKRRGAGNYVPPAIYDNGASQPFTYEEDANYFLYPYHSIISDLGDGICCGH